MINHLIKEPLLEQNMLSTHWTIDSAVQRELRVNHGIYIRWYLIKRCARKVQSLLFDLYMAFD